MWHSLLTPGHLEVAIYLKYVSGKEISILVHSLQRNELNIDMCIHNISSHINLLFTKDLVFVNYDSKINYQDNSSIGVTS